MRKTRETAERDRRVFLLQTQIRSRVQMCFSAYKIADAHQLLGEQLQFYYGDPSAGYTPMVVTIRAVVYDADGLRFCTFESGNGSNQLNVRSLKWDTLSGKWTWFIQADESFKPVEGHVTLLGRTDSNGAYRRSIA